MIPSLRPATLPDGAPDVDALRETYGCFPTGVVAVAAVRDDRPVGLAASSFTSVSLTPPLVSLSIQRTSTTWPMLEDRPMLGLSVLGAAQGPLCRQLSAKTGDRFASVAWTVTTDGAVLLEDAVAWLSCVLEDTVAAGDHLLILLRVAELNTRPGAPLVFHASSFHRLQPWES